MTITEFLETIELKYSIKIDPQKLRRWQDEGLVRDLREGHRNYREFSTIFEDVERQALLLATGLPKELVGDTEAETSHLEGLSKMVKELT